MKPLRALMFLSTMLLACCKPDHATLEPTSPPTTQEAARPKPLSTYLDGAVAAKVFALAPSAAGGLARTEVTQLDAAKTKDFLARVGLAQRADGPLVRCPNDKEVVISNAAGARLGTIGYCQGHARFDAPDGTAGGIEAPLP